jgi:hypothetical protein
MYFISGCYLHSKIITNDFTYKVQTIQYLNLFKKNWIELRMKA